MKTLSEKSALAKLRALKNELRAHLREVYERRAKDCQTCEVQGVCCTDAHFVNVHITRLEAALMHEELEKLPEAKRREIAGRVERAIEEFGLTADGDTFAQTFACPLFEKGTGCLVHAVKPVPCLQHACYERSEDLPPAELQENAEAAIERLNRGTYRRAARWLPLPVALRLSEND